MEEDTFDADENYMKENNLGSDEFAYDLRIPEERVGVLIGVQGKVKAEI